MKTEERSPGRQRRCRTLIALAAAGFLALQGCGSGRELDALRSSADSLSQAVSARELAINRLIYERYIAELRTGHGTPDLEAFEAAGVNPAPYYAQNDSLRAMRDEYEAASAELAAILKKNSEYEALQKKYVPVLGTPSMRREYDERMASLDEKLVRSDAAYRHAKEQESELRHRIGQQILPLMVADYQQQERPLPAALIPDSLYEAITGSDELRVATTELTALQNELREKEQAIEALDPAGKTK